MILVYVVEDIVDLYDSAFQAFPHEEWGNHWFMAIVRVGDFKKLQLVNGIHLGSHEIE